MVIVVMLAVGGVIAFNRIPKKGSDEGATYQKSAPQGEPEAKLVALGSSFSRATNLSTSMQGENNDYSFSTGTKISSLYVYLKGKEKGLTATNLAHPGASMQDILERQLPEAIRLHPKYVTIDPASDLVSKNSLSEYKKNLIQIVDGFNSQTTIMIFTYPNFLFMRSANYPSCQENKVGVKLENLSDENILAFNHAMKETLNNRSNVMIIDIYDLFGPGDVSDYDCLHTNLGAQEKVAKEFIKALQ